MGFRHMAGRQGWQPTKEMPCNECGNPVTVNAQTVKAPRCYECGLAAHVEQIRQMAAKSGPYYDRWLETNGPKGRPKGGGTPFEITPDNPDF